jgi:hypothetical protein
VVVVSGTVVVVVSGTVVVVSGGAVVDVFSETVVEVATVVAVSSPPHEAVTRAQVMPTTARRRHKRLHEGGFMVGVSLSAGYSP